MPRSSGGRLFAEFWNGGHGYWNIVNSKNQNWWCCPTIKQPPPATITSTIQPAFEQRRNQVIDYPSLSTLLQENLFCRTRVSTFVDENSKQTLRAFVTYLKINSAYHITTMAEKCDSFLEQADKGQDFQWWNSLPVTECMSVLNMSRLTFTDDMGWQQWSSGNKYNSVSGPALCIGGYTRKILDYRVKSKLCNVCNRAIWYKQPIKHHVCSKNHITGSSKAMEPDDVGVEKNDGWCN